MLSPLWPLATVLACGAVGAALISAWLSPRLQPLERPPRFEDATAAAGLPVGESEPAAGDDEPPSTLPGAVAFLDFDGDGRPDLLALAPPRWPSASAPLAATPGCALYHNDGNGRFSDATRGSGLVAPPLPMSVAIGDYANEGRPDIFITGVGGNRLFHNLGNGRFEDVTEAAGVRGDDHVWSTGAVWLDIDGDGRLDLVVCNYARWPRGADLSAALGAERAGPSYGAPAGFASCFPTVYRNLGGGRFKDVTRTSGLEVLDRQTGFPRAFPLAVAAVDANGDGRLDLLFTYQSGEDALFLNQGDGTFRPAAPGSARREGASADIAATGGGPNFLDLSPADSRFDALRRAGLLFEPDGAAPAGVCPLRYKLGVALIDAGLNGRFDIVSAEGLAEPGLERFDGLPSLRSRPLLLRNVDGRWQPAAIGAAGRPARLRGVAVADIDGSGLLSVALGQYGGPPRLLRNRTRAHHGWLRVDLVGTKTQRDGGGAEVEVYTPRRMLRQTMVPAMGFMSQSESTLTFGLGDDSRITRVVVRWPSGLTQQVRSPAPDQRLVITEPSAP